MTTYNPMSATQAAAKGFRAETRTADEMFVMLEAAGRDMRVWESFGHARAYGQEMFAKSLLHANPKTGRVEVLNDRQQVVSAFPLNEGRTIRVLVR